MYYYPRYRNFYFSSRPYVSRRVVYNPGINFSVPSALAKAVAIYEIGKHVLLPAANVVAKDVKGVAERNFPETAAIVQKIGKESGKSLDHNVATSLQGLYKKANGGNGGETMRERGEKAGEELSHMKKNGQGR